MIVCVACTAEAPDGQRFCGQCGAPLARGCPSCGSENPPGNRFCGTCGTALVPSAAGGSAGTQTAAAAPAPENGATSPERRLVSVLFVDLVGFTTLSEHRDPEEVRALLSSYFERCHSVIERFGGTVEKFIGDAVMAVWGAPVAREDDAERAVRAALGLVGAVTLLGEEVGLPDLRARAGVLTGSAAVDVGAEGEGMVLGDTVNTASRLQSIAEPGTVLVDDITRWGSEAAVAYEEAGTHQVKGREQPVRAWRALRIVAGAGGARRMVGLEAPFVGREHELQGIISAAQASGDESRARHLAIVGEAGSGKSRLVWEYFKYLDGISEIRWWHQGRCLSYGEGVAYWALAEMVRWRAGIVEEDRPAVAREKLRIAVEEHVPDERERRLVEPRLAHLLRLEDRPDADRADLFSGWRLFFERLAGQHPVTLVFEDLQWADSGLLDFIDYLLEWSAEYPIFVLTVGRPELGAARASWDPVVLERLEPDAIGAILEGLAPGLPAELVARIGHRSEGIPLYAVETIRMLQDRGVLVQEGSRYLVTSDVVDLDVPETLQALVASRLDGLSAGERSLLQDTSVLGQSFTAGAAAALSGRPEADVVGVLDTLVVKQVLGRDDDPRSPERGQYTFLQALLRTVAYGTLTRAARKARHLAAARHLRQTWPGEARDIAEVLAAHYLEAINADPNADDVAELRAAARERLIAAGRAAASLALGPEAQRYFDQAAGLADDDGERAALFDQAGRALRQSGDPAAAEEQLRRAVELWRSAGVETGGSAAVALASVLRVAGRLDEALELLEPFRSGADERLDPVVHAEGLAELATALVFSDAVDEAAPLFERALLTLEEQLAWRPLAEAQIGRAIMLLIGHRVLEASSTLELAIRLAEEHDLPAVALRGRYNRAALQIEDDHLEEAIAEARDGLALARERGDRSYERLMLQQMASPAMFLGRWDEAEGIARGLMREELDFDTVGMASVLVEIAAARGDEEAYRQCCAIAERVDATRYVELRTIAAMIVGRRLLEEGAPAESFSLLRPKLGVLGTSKETAVQVFMLCIEAAIALPGTEPLEELAGFAAALPPARATPLMRAGRARVAAELADRRGDVAASAQAGEEAIAELRAAGTGPLLACALAEHGHRHGRADSLAEARTIYAELGAVRWLERLDRPLGETVAAG